ncbi:hypothetical protein JCM17844_20660 [Iodidimonas gelatinilytica]|uniref:Uncharacterized protein n=1 Tax=Iodidimonas gelatinilytica TaxID=1236966 RepID=A0A5A7MUA1_9PROT|nr:hypothetical protein JCM17844_20660 [Iodidimonas gelatinilytica]
MGVAGKDVIGNPDETLEILFGLNLTHLDFHMINHIPYPLPHFHISFPYKGLAFLSFMAKPFPGEPRQPAKGGRIRG